MDGSGTERDWAAALEDAVFDFLERQPVEGHGFQLVVKDSAGMKYVFLDRMFRAYRVEGSGRSFSVTGVADDGSRYLESRGGSLEEVYAYLSSVMPVMNLAPGTDGHLNCRREGILDGGDQGFEYTFRSVVLNVDAYQEQVLEGMTSGRTEPEGTEDPDVDRQIRRFAELSGSSFEVDSPGTGRYVLRSPEGISLEYRVHADGTCLRSCVDDIRPKAELLGQKPFDVYVALSENLPFSPVYEDGRIGYVNLDTGADSPMRKLIMEQSFDCLEAHDAYRMRILDLGL